MLLNRLLLPKYLGSRKNRLYFQSRVDFYTGRNSLTHTTSLKNIISQQSINSSCSINNIAIQDIDFGISSKELLKIKGKPNFIQKKGLASDNLKTFFYRESLKGVKCILQFHFYNDQFFYGHMELRHNKCGFKEEIEELIKNKYGIDQIRNGAIIDQSGNKIYFKNDIIPSLSYITGDKHIKESIRKELNKRESISNRKSSMQMAQILDLI